MSKKHIEALITAEFVVLSAKDSKERLKYIVAGIKDGKFYDYAGTDYGIFDEAAPDTVFIEESDLELSRITSSKITTITMNMKKFFTEYNGEVDEDTMDTDKSSDDVVSDSDDDNTTEDTIDTEAVEKACKKAIKKGDFSKAQKLIDKLGGHSKLQKKLDKAQ